MMATYRGFPVKSILYAEDTMIHGETLVMYMKMDVDVFMKSSLYRTFGSLFNCENPNVIHTTDGSRLYAVCVGVAEPQKCAGCRT